MLTLPGLCLRRRKPRIEFPQTEHPMPKIHLIRHGHVAPGDRGCADPGLDDLGLAQATSLAQRLAEQFPRPLPILSSPLLRCRQTAAPLAQLWGSAPTIDARVSEIPSPSAEPAARKAWLTEMLAASWPDAASPDSTDDFAMRLSAWQNDALAALAERAEDTVIFSHYFAINWLCSAASDSVRIDRFRPAHTAMISCEFDRGVLSLIEEA